MKKIDKAALAKIRSKATIAAKPSDRTSVPKVKVDVGALAKALSKEKTTRKRKDRDEEEHTVDLTLEPSGVSAPPPPLPSPVRQGAEIKEGQVDDLTKTPRVLPTPKPTIPTTQLPKSSTSSIGLVYPGGSAFPSTVEEGSPLSDPEACLKRLRKFVEPEAAQLGVCSSEDLGRNLVMSTCRNACEIIQVLARLAGYEKRLVLSNGEIRRLEGELKAHNDCPGKISKLEEELKIHAHCADQISALELKAAEHATCAGTLNKALKEKEDAEQALSAERKKTSELEAGLQAAKNEAARQSDKVLELQKAVGVAKVDAVADYLNSDDASERAANYFVSGFEQLKRRVLAQFPDVAISDWMPEPESDQETEAATQLGGLGAGEEDDAQSKPTA